MGDRLPGVRPVVEDEAVAALVGADLAGDALRRAEHRREERTVLGPHRVGARDVLTRHDQDVGRRLRIEVVEGDDRLVLEGDSGRYLTTGDAAEQAAFGHRTYPRSFCANRIALTAAIEAVSARRMRRPSVTGAIPAARAHSAPWGVKPPSGPTNRLSEKAPRLGLRSAARSDTSLSPSHSSSEKPRTDSQACSNGTAGCRIGSLPRPDCSAASTRMRC